MIRLFIWWANVRFRASRNVPRLRTRLRQARYWLWAVTREDRPDRRMEMWSDVVLPRMVAERAVWEGCRFRDGRLVDARGRFVNPDRLAERTA